jgi:hypothetical protein
MWTQGDAPQYWSEMQSVNGLPPFPNGIIWNWATIFILGFGNLSAIDFQVNMMPSVVRYPRASYLRSDRMLAPNRLRKRYA